MLVTLFRDVYAKTKEELDLSFDDLVRLIAGAKAAEKRGLPLLKLGTFGDSPDPTSKSLRRDENLLTVCGVECDYDGKRISFDAAVASARSHNLQAILYTTPSHEPGAPKWRVLLPASTTLPPSDRAALADRANTVFGGELARETWTLSQSFYYGAVSEHFQLVPVSGVPIDTLDTVEGTPFGDSRPPPPKDRRRKTDPASPKSFDELPRKTQKAIRSGDSEKLGYKSRSEMVYKVVCDLIRGGWTDESIAELLIDPDRPISALCLSKRHPKGEALRQARQIREDVLRDWRRDQKGNVVANDEGNVQRAMAELGVQFSWNTFTAKGYVNGIGPLRSLDDHEVNELRLTLHREYDMLTNKDFFYDLVDHFTHESPFHPVIDYLDGLEWDGRDRLGQTGCCQSWLTTYGGADDSDYTRAVGRLILVAAVRRLKNPGCKFDEMLVLVDPNQGTDKSSVLRLLARHDEWFTDSMPLAARDKEVIEHLAGRWIVENSELNGIKHNQVEEIKSFLSRQIDRARLAYGRLTIDAPRQCVFFGTTNSDNFLREIQNRRFWPVKVTGFDLLAMERDVDQLWAEAAEAERRGESIRLDPSLYGAAAEVQAAHRQEEPWTTDIGAVLQGRCGKIASKDVWSIVGKPTGMKMQHDNQRLGEAMRELGFTRRQSRVYGQVSWTYVKNDPQGHAPQIYVLPDTLTPGRVFASYKPDGEDDYEVAKDEDVPEGDYTPGEDEDIPF